MKLKFEQTIDASLEAVWATVNISSNVHRCKLPVEVDEAGKT